MHDTVIMGAFATKLAYVRLSQIFNTAANGMHVIDKESGKMVYLACAVVADPGSETEKLARKIKPAKK